jgi:putative colanic acid biosysnthesis UDP-glucose lipid carrier transferase
MTARFLRLLQFLITVIDILTLNIIFFTTILLYPRSLFSENWKYGYLAIFLSLSWIVVSFLSNLYNSKNIFSFERFTKQTMKAVFYFSILFIFSLFFYNQFSVSRLFLLIILVSLPLSFLISRFLFFVVYKHYKRKDFLLDKVIIVGYNNISKQLISHFEENSYNKEIIGICEEAELVDEIYHYPILSGISGVSEVCKHYGANEIFSSIAPEQNPEIYNLMQFADQNCIRFRIVPDISFFVKRKVHINYIHDLPILTLRDEPLEDLDNKIKKRLFDIIISSFVILFVLSWLIPIIALLIWLDSGGSVFFKQIRSGKGNMQFKCLKFRSMKINKSANSTPATRDDQRFTRVGKFLRRTSLDELPQFLNVFKGNMSIVGPRPHMLKHTDEFSKVVNQYMIRHFLKPGITGWAQVNGYRGEVNTLEKLHGRVEHDIWYMENWSIWLDLKIMFLTVYNSIRGDENAY